MGRKTVEGLEYFPVDIGIFDDKKILMAQEIVDPAGKYPFERFCVPYVAIRMLREVYKNGYYIEWNDEICLRFVKEIGNGITYDLMKTIIHSFFKVGFLNETIFIKHNIITSHGIQKRWFFIMERYRRTISKMRQDILLIEKSYSHPNKNANTSKKSKKITSEDKPITSEDKPITSEDKPITSRSYAAAFSLFNNTNRVYTVGYGVLSREYIMSNIRKEIIELLKEKYKITSEDKPITSEDKPITSEDKPITSEDKPITSEDKPITSEDKPITSEDKPITSEEMLNQIVITENKGVVNPFSEHKEFNKRWLIWRKYMKAQHEIEHKSFISEQAALERLVKCANGNVETAIEIIKETISRGWKTFFTPQNDKNGKQSTNPEWPIKGHQPFDIQSAINKINKLPD